MENIEKLKGKRKDKEWKFYFIKIIINVVYLWLWTYMKYLKIEKCIGYSENIWLCMRTQNNWMSFQHKKLTNRMENMNTIIIDINHSKLYLKFYNLLFLFYMLI